MIIVITSHFHYYYSIFLHVALKLTSQTFHFWKHSVDEWYISSYYSLYSYTSYLDEHCGKKRVAVYFSLADGKCMLLISEVSFYLGVGLLLTPLVSSYDHSHLQVAFIILVEVYYQLKKDRLDYRFSVHNVLCSVMVSTSGYRHTSSLYQGCFLCNRINSCMQEMSWVIQWCWWMKTPYTYFNGVTGLAVPIACPTVFLAYLTKVEEGTRVLLV